MYAGTHKFAMRKKMSQPDSNLGEITVSPHTLTHAAELQNEFPGI